MDFSKLLDGFHFNDEAFLDQEVNSKSTLKAQTIIFDANRHLSGDLKALPTESFGKNQLIYIFEKPRAKIAVDANRFGDDR